jgi:hypothetical protein
MSEPGFDRVDALPRPAHVSVEFGLVADHLAQGRCGSSKFSAKQEQRVDDGGGNGEERRRLDALNDCQSGQGNGPRGRNLLPLVQRR